MAKVGRPPKYNTPEEMQVVIDQYFDKVTFIHPETKQEVCRPTISGMAYELGMSRRALVDYAHKDEFLPTIKEARLRVEQALEAHLYGSAVTGMIFNLKNNFGWKDKTETDVTTGGDKIKMPPITFNPVSNSDND